MASGAKRILLSPGSPSRATLKAGMMERRNDGTAEWWKITRNPKRWNHGTAERRKIP